MTKRTLGTLFSIAVAIGAVGCSSTDGAGVAQSHSVTQSSVSASATTAPITTAKQSGPVMLKLGETATVEIDNKYGGHAKVTVSNLTQLDGGTFRVSIVVEAVEGNPHYNALNFKVRTKEGKQLEYARGGDTLGYGSLLPGEKAVGDITFDPAGGTAETLSFIPNFDRVAIWKLS